MPNFNPEFVGDKSFAANHLLDIITNLQEWNKYSMPDTESLRRIISLVDWASREPKRWLVFRIFYLEGITDIHAIASRLHITERTVRRYLRPVKFPHSLPCYLVK